MKQHPMLRAVLCLAVVLCLILTACSSVPQDTTLEPLETEQTDKETNKGLSDLVEGAEELLKDNEELLDDVKDYLSDPENWPDELRTAVETLEAETEGMTREESIEYWLRKALALVEEKLPEERKEQIQAALDQLYAAGMLLEEALYDTENLLFTYIVDGGSLGGVDLKDENRVLNTSGNTSYGSTDSYADLLESKNPNASQVLVLNGFEDLPFRTDYYMDLYTEWSDMGIGVTLDNEVCVSDLAALEHYDAIVFSMHGSTYLDQPILALDEVPSAEKDQLYADYLYTDYSVAKVLYVDGSSAYWVMPDFFRNQYGTTGLDQKIIFSESCCFFGCECYTSEFDTTFSQSFLDASAESVMGYFNSVGAEYSRNVMRTTMEYMYYGMPAYEAINEAVGVYGTDDGWIEPADDKYLGSPVFSGDENALLSMPEAPIVPEKTPEEQPIIPADEAANLDKAIEVIEASLYDQLIGVYASTRFDGSFYLPYYNFTGYDFKLNIDLEFFYNGKLVSEDGTYTYELDEYDYIEIPVNFPNQCDAWNLWFTFSDISYNGTALS